MGFNATVIDVDSGKQYACELPFTVEGTVEFAKELDMPAYRFMFWTYENVCPLMVTKLETDGHTMLNDEFVNAFKGRERLDRMNAACAQIISIGNDETQERRAVKAITDYRNRHNGRIWFADLLRICYDIADEDAAKSDRSDPDSL